MLGLAEDCVSQRVVRGQLALGLSTSGEPSNLLFLK